MADLPQINVGTITARPVEAERDPAEERRAEARLQEKMQEELDRVGGDPARLRVTAALVRECRRDLMARGVRAELVNTYLNDYFRTGNGSLIPRDDASAVNQALNEPVPTDVRPDPAAAGRDARPADRGPDPRTPTAHADAFVKGDPRAPTAHPNAAAKAAPQPNTPPPPPPPVVVAGTPPPPPPPGSPPPVAVALGPDGHPLPASTSGDAPVLTPTGTSVALSVPGTVSEAPVESPPPVRFFSLGADYGQGRNPDPDAIAALIERGRGLAAMVARGGNMAGAPVPNPMPSPRPTGDGFTLADSSVGSCSDEGGSGTDRPEGGTSARGGRPTLRDCKIGYFRGGVRA
jgi:hypothetical protein